GEPAGEHPEMNGNERVAVSRGGLALRAALLAFLLWPLAAHAAFVPKAYFIFNFACGVFGPPNANTTSSLANVCSCGGLAGQVGLCNPSTQGSNVVSAASGTPANCGLKVPDQFCRQTFTNKDTGATSVSDPSFAIGIRVVNVCPGNSTPNPDGSCTCPSSSV